MAFRTSGRASPNLPSKYRSTPPGSMGLDLITARTPSSVFMAGNARPKSPTRNSFPRSCSRTFLSSFGVGLKMPSRWPLLCAFRPASALPSDKASSGLNPNRSATTEAQRVNTGARLIRILFAVMAVSICSGIQSGRADSRSQRHPDRIGDLKFMAGEISVQEGADPLSGGSETLKSNAGDSIFLNQLVSTDVDGAGHGLPFQSHLRRYCFLLRVDLDFGDAANSFNFLIDERLCGCLDCPILQGTQSVGEYFEHLDGGSM